MPGPHAVADWRAMRAISLGLVITMVLLAWASGAEADYEDGAKALRRGELEAAKDAWRPLANKGDRRAEFGLSRILLRQGDMAGVLLLRASAEAGYLPAEAGMAKLSALGMYMPRDLKRSHAWLKKATGHKPAEQARHLVEAADAHIQAADYYLSPGEHQDLPEATRHLRWAADAGHPTAQCYYAMLLAGWSPGKSWPASPKNKVEAHKYFRLCAQNPGSGGGEGHLLMLDFRLQESMTKAELAETRKRVKAWLRAKDAKQHGQLFDRGKSPPSPGRRALQELETVEAAINQFRVEAIDPDCPSERYWVRTRELAEGTTPREKTWIEHWIMDRCGTTVKLRVTFERNERGVWAQFRAALDVDEEIQKRLTEAQKAYEREDYENAREMWTDTAQHGHPDAQLALGRLHEKGHGVTRDLAEAHKWYVLAWKLGSVAAREHALSVRDAMDDDQLEDSRQRIRAFLDPPGDRLFEPLFPTRVGDALGFIDRTGAEIIAPRFEPEAAGLLDLFDREIQSFTTELLRVRFVSWSWLVDRKGEYASAPYEAIGDFHDGRAPVMKSGKWGYVNRKGALVIGLKFDLALEFNAGAAQVWIGEKWGLIRTNGTFAVSPRFQTPPRGCGSVHADGLFLFCEGNKRGLVRADGQITVPARFDDLHFVHDGVVNARVGDKMGLVDVNTGQVVIKSRFDVIHPFHGDFASVQLADRMGFIDRRGRWIDSPGDRWSRDFAGSLWRFQRGVRWGLYDVRKKKVVVEATFSSIGEVHEGLATFQVDDKYGYLDEKGKIVIEPRFAEAKDFKDGLAIVSVPGSPDPWPRLHGYIDRSGSIVIEPKFASVTEFVNGLALVKVTNDGEDRYIDKQGKTVFQFPPGSNQHSHD